MLRRILLARLEKRIARAEKLGAITAEEASLLREEAASIPQKARAVDYIMLLEMIALIIELIRAWLETRE